MAFQMTALITRLRNRFFHIWFLLTRPMTLGARVALIQDDKILLIKHTYVRGWHLPGGGVDSGETLAQAAKRECAEEAGFNVSELTLFQIYKNNIASKRDHVALYHAVSAEPLSDFQPDTKEISAIDFFPLNALPDDVSPATLRRIHELTGRAQISDEW